jgi:hypothetical protein
MTLELTKEMVENYKRPNSWDLSNKILYDLCADNFQHDTPEKIIAKTLLIGRVYAVALERRKNKTAEDVSDDFYLVTVAKAFNDRKLDEKLLELKAEKELTLELLPKVFAAHEYLTEIIYKITELKKRPFSSKYLHFHLPQLFYIYDARAREALSMFIRNVPKDLQHIIPKEDCEYHKFFCKCIELHRTVHKDFNINLTPRQVDNLLIEIANKHPKTKMNM